MLRRLVAGLVARAALRSDVDALRRGLWTRTIGRRPAALVACSKPLFLRSPVGADLNALSSSQAAPKVFPEGTTFGFRDLFFVKYEVSGVGQIRSVAASLRVDTTALAQQPWRSSPSCVPAQHAKPPQSHLRAPCRAHPFNRTRSTALYPTRRQSWACEPFKTFQRTPPQSRM